MSLMNKLTNFRSLTRVFVAPIVVSCLLFSSCSKNPTRSTNENVNYQLRVTPNNGEAPLEVLLDVSDSTGRAVEYGFDFGDSTSYMEAEGNFPDGILDGKTRHIYWNPGEYVVKTSVKDAKGNYHFLEDTLNFSERRLDGRIIFRQSVNGDRGDIISMDPYGENQKNLTGDFYPRMKCILPSVSGDGSKIVFSLLYDLYGQHHYDVWTTDVRGLLKEQLTRGSGDNLYPVFSPDGKKIAFLRDGSPFVMNSDGTNLKNIQTDKNYGQKLSWSSDSERLVFISQGDLYSVDSYGGDLKRLTYDVAGEVSPSYSPDGKKVVFARQDGWGADTEVYIINADGSDSKNISENPDGSDTDPLWSPDGKKMAFVRGNYQPGFGERHAIFMMNADGSNQQNVSGNAKTNDFLYSWSPDGKYLVYSSYPVMGDWRIPNLFVVDTSGLYRKQITDNGYFNGEAVWIR